MQEGAAEGGSAGGQHRRPSRQAGHPLKPRGHARTRTTPTGRQRRGSKIYIKTNEKVKGKKNQKKSDKSSLLKIILY